MWTGLIEGTLDVAMGSYTAAQAALQSNNGVLIAVHSKKVPAIPNVKTLPELGATSKFFTVSGFTGWAVPKDHPDIDPAHEALQLRELYREAARLEATGKHGDEFRQWLIEAETNAAELETALRASPPDTAKAKAAFESSRSLCTRCHEKYRN